MNKQYILASNNKNKLKEIRDILSPLGIEVVSQKEVGINIEVEETGTTYEENATLKAKAVYKLTGKPTIADDSGMNVDFLNGEPGIYSARFLGENTPFKQKCKKILDMLKDTEEEKRNAKFVCAICFIDENGKTHLFRGECDGKIAKSIRGENGFGYDPIFEVNGKTFGEMGESKKNEISHRNIALKKFAEFIKKTVISK